MGTGKTKRQIKQAKTRPKAVDWGEIFWRLQGLYPNDERFNKDNFAKCSLLLIEQALQSAVQRQLEQAAMNAAPIAAVGTIIAAATGAKLEPSFFNPFEAALYEKSAKQACDIEAARAFLQMAKEGLLPSWAINRVDINLIKAAAN